MGDFYCCLITLFQRRCRGLGCFHLNSPTLRFSARCVHQVTLEQHSLDLAWYWVVAKWKVFCLCSFDWELKMQDSHGWTTFFQRLVLDYSLFRLSVLTEFLIPFALNQCQDWYPSNFQALLMGIYLVINATWHQTSTIWDSEEILMILE